MAKSDGLFDYKDDDAARLHRQLIESTDGTEPCYDPYLLQTDGRIYESHTDLWVENYSNRGVSPEKAAEMCAGCHVLDLCREYARANDERTGIWGGETPRQRGWYKGKKLKE